MIVWKIIVDWPFEGGLSFDVTIVSLNMQIVSVATWNAYSGHLWIWQIFWWKLKIAPLPRAEYKNMHKSNKTTI